MQPRILGRLECAAASAAQTKLRATEGAQLRLKTNVSRNAASGSGRMNHRRYFERKRAEMIEAFSNLEHTETNSEQLSVEYLNNDISFSLSPNGIRIGTEFLLFNEIQELTSSLTLRQLIQIQRGSFAAVPFQLCFRTLSAIHALELESRFGLTLYNSLKRLLTVQRASQKQPSEPAGFFQAYCPTCQSYKRRNSKGICRLCKDILE